MSSKRAFTLLEVLLAIVLLAIVVGVSVPYLRAWGDLDPVADESSFQAQVAQSIAASQRSQPLPMASDQYRELAQSQGWSFNRVEHSSSSQIDLVSRGEWVIISDGEQHSIHWAKFQRENGAPHDAE